MNSEPVRTMSCDITPKQEVFCREYLADFNGKQAAIRAGYSPKTAAAQASRLLTNANVSVKLSAMAQQRMDEADVTVARVIKEFLRIAMADVGQAFDEHDKLLPLKEMPEDVRRAISSIETEELWDWDDETEQKKRTGVIRKVKFWDKKGSLDSLAKYLQMFVERLDVTSNGERLTLEALIVGSMHVRIESP